MKIAEVSTQEPCPCGSGKLYGRCCKRRKFKWVRDRRGRLAKQFPLRKEVVQIVKRSREKFLETFGRSPRKSDPLFVDKYYLSSNDLEREMLRAMKAAKSPPALIYAHKKTGFIVGNRNVLSTAEQKEWDAAIDEFYSRIESGQDAEETIDDEGLPRFMQEGIRHNQIVSGYFIEKHFNRRRKRQVGGDVEMIAAFAMTNFTRSLRSIHILLENGVGFDAYHLLRALYENYLTAKYVYNHPERVEIFIAQLGLLSGTHALATNKSGVSIQSKLVETSTGKITDVPSRWQIVKELGVMDEHLYNDVYRALSSYCHSEITNIGHFISNGAYDYLSPDFSFDVLVVCHLLSMLFFSCIKMHCPSAKYLKRDLSTNAERSLFTIGLVERYLADTREQKLPAVYEMAIADVVRLDPRLRSVYETMDQVLADF